MSEKPIFEENTDSRDESPYQEYFRQAESSLIKGRPDEAIEALLVARSLYADSLEVGRKLARVCYDANQGERAVRELRLLYHKFPRDEELNFELARICHSLQRYDQAAYFYERTLEINAIHQEAIRQYANLLLYLKQNEKALVILERLRLLDSRNIDVLSQIAEAWMNLGNTVKAIEQLKLAYRLEPTSLELRLKLAQIHVQENLYDQAIKLLMPLEEDGEISKEKLKILVDCYIGEQKFDSASELLYKYESLYPQDPVVYKKFAQLNLRIQLFDEVEKALLKVFQLEKLYHNVVAVTQFYTEREEFRKLEHFLSDRLMDFPREPDLYYQLALLYRHDSPLEALTYVDKVIELQLEHKGASLLKGELYMKLNKYPKAVEWYESIQERFPDIDFDFEIEKLLEQDRKYRDTATLYKKAQAALDSNSFRKALQIYKEMVEKVPDNAEWLEQLGNLYSFEANYYEAVQAFEKAVLFARISDHKRLKQKIFLLCYLYNDFQKAEEILQQIKVEPDEILTHQLQILKINRHLLFACIYPIKHFEEMMEEIKTLSQTAINPTNRLNHAYSYLFLGSHLLDSSVWAGEARRLLHDFLNQREYGRLHLFALDALYLVSLMEGEHVSLLPILKRKFELEPTRETALLLLSELRELGSWEEGIVLLEDLIAHHPEDLDFRRNRAYFYTASTRQNAPRSPKKWVAAVQQEIALQPKNPLLYFDLAMGLLYSTESQPSEEDYQRMVNAIRKVAKLGDEREELQIAMLDILDYAALLNPQERKLNFSKKKMFLEKELSRMPDSALLLKEMGRLLIQNEEDAQNGFRYLIKALTLEPDLVEANLYLGDYYFQQKEVKKAYHYYLKMIEQPIPRQVWNEILEKKQRMV